MPVTVAELMVLIGADTSRLEYGLNRTEDLLKQTGRETEAAVQGLRNLESVGRDIERLGQRLTWGITMPVAGLATAAIKANVELDSLKRGLDLMTGSADKSTRILNAMKDIAKDPGMGFHELLRAYVNLNAAGMESEMAIRTVREFGNAIAAVGRGKNDMEGVERALTKMMSSQRVYAREINQIAIRVPQIRAFLKDAFGTDRAKEIAEFGLTGEEFIGRLIEVMEKSPRAISGIRNDIENFQDSMQRALSTLGDSLAPGLGRFLNWLGPALENAADWFARLPQPVRDFSIATVALLAAIGPAIWIFGTLIRSLLDIKEGIGAILMLKEAWMAYWAAKTAAINAATAATVANTVATNANTAANAVNAAGMGVGGGFSGWPAGTGAWAAGGATAAKWGTGAALGTGLAGLGAGFGARAALGAGAAAIPAALPAGATTAAAAGAIGLSTAALGAVVGAILIAIMAAIALKIGQKDLAPMVDRWFDENQHKEFGSQEAAGRFSRKADEYAASDLRSRPSLRGAAQRMMRQYGWTEERAWEEIERVRSQNDAGSFDQATSRYGPLVKKKSASELERERRDWQAAEAQEFQARMSIGRAGVARLPDSSRPMAEARTLIPMLRQRMQELLQQAAEIQPQIKDNAEMARRYWTLQQEASGMQLDIDQLWQRSVEQQKQNWDKMVEHAAKRREHQLSMREMSARAMIGEAPEGYRAAYEFGGMAPIIQQRMSNAYRTAQQLSSQKMTPEIEQRIWDLERQYWDGALEIRRLRMAAVQEERERVKRAEREAERVTEQQHGLLMDIAQMAVRHAPEGFQIATSVQRVVPLLRQEQNRILAAMRGQDRQSAEYWENARQVVQIESRIQDYQNDAVKERKQALDKANREAVRQRREQRDILDMEARLIESRFKNNPFLSPQQAARAMMPALIQQYREMMMPVQGETYREQLERNIDAERVRGQILEGAGFGRKGGWKRTLGGGMMFTGDIGLAKGVMSELDKIAAEAQEAAAAASGGNTIIYQTLLDPRASLEQQHREFEKQWEHYEKMITQPIGRVPGFE